MQLIRALVVDDEAEARRGLCRLLDAQSGVEVVGECPDGRAAVEAIRALAPDLVFLDVQMPEVDGFEVLRRLGPQRPPCVIFVTAYDRYALEAFEVHAVDYLLKPFSDRRFRDALQQAKAMLRSETGVDELERRFEELLSRIEALPEPEAAHPALQRIAVESAGRVLFVDVGELYWIEAADNYVRLHLAQRSYLLRGTLTEMEARLDPRHFLRVHRSRIVNIDRVREMRPLTSGDCVLVLDDGTEVTSSRTYADQRRRALNFLD